MGGCHQRGIKEVPPNSLMRSREADYPFTFTVFTPTFNRAQTLPRVYRSLQEQTFKDFEWLLVDDGSTDETPVRVKEWQKEAPFPIRYIWQENQGKHVAFNRGVNQAQGAFFLLIDSDDALVPEALERFKFYWESVPQDKRNQFVGVSGLCRDQQGHLIGDRFPADVLDSDSLEIRYRFKVRGEKSGFQRTEILKKYPFPVIPGAKFIPEGIVWSAIGQRYKTRFINLPLRIYYRNDSTLNDQLSKTPSPALHAVGHTCWHQSRLTREMGWFFYDPQEFLRSALHYARFSFHAGIRFRDQFKGLPNTPARCLYLLLLPAALLVFLKDPK